MKSLLQSTDNTCSVLPGSLRYVRSDVPYRITPEDRQWLLDRDLRTVIDLRTRAEQERKPCPLAEDERFCYRHMPVTGGDRVPSSPEEVTDSYISMVDGRMREIISAIRNAPTGVLFFCNAGKDRTGVVSAILQKQAGMLDAEIVRGYAASWENLRDKLEAFAAANPEIDLQVITPKPEYMERFLQWYAVSGKAKMEE